MKMNRNSHRLLQTSLAGLGLLGAINLALAVPDRVINTFDANINGCGNAWGGAAGLFDPAQDNTGNAGGSLYISSDFAADQNTLTYFCNQPPNGGWWFPGPAFNISDYKSVEFDIKWDTTKTVSIADFNNLPQGGEGGIVIWATDYPGFTVRPTLGNVPVPATAATGWAHVSLAVNPAITGIDPSVGIVFKKWISANQKAAGGTYGFWVDNVVLKGSDAPPPPPTLALTKAVPGLAFVAASAGQYDRQSIRTVGSNYSWIGSSAPVSYSIDVAKIGENAPAPTGFTLFTHFVPGGANPTRPDSDWHEPNVLMWTIGNSADGTAWSQLRYKTNSPDNNGILYDAGAFPGGVWNPTPAGTWTISFSQNTNIIITAPNGGSITNILPPEVVAIFNATPQMQVNVGCVPGELVRIGQKAIVTGVRIIGKPGTPDLSSNFLGVPLNTNDWTIVASSPTYGVQEVPLDAPFWLTWSLPASGFSLQSSDKVAGGIWANPTLAGYDAGNFHHILLNQTNLPGSTLGVYRMLKRVGAKLLVLLPGETLAPGTPTGKTGTPDGQKSDIEFNITVRLMDKDNYPVSAPNDLIRLAATGTPYVTLPPDANLLSGSLTLPVTISGEGSVTLTASDVDNPAITPGSSSVAVTY
jgi:hypothetical protein